MSHSEIIRSLIREELDLHSLTLMALSERTKDKALREKREKCIRAIRLRTINALSREDLAGWLGVTTATIERVDARREKNRKQLFENPE